MKKLIILFTLLCIPLTGCAKTRDVSVADTKVCKSTIKDNVGTVWIFKLSRSNEILGATLETHISPKYLIYRYGKDDLEASYMKTKEVFIKEYNAIKPKMESKKWFKAEINGNDKDMKIDTKYSMVFTGEHFDYRLNDYFLAQFNLDKLYDNDKQTMIFDSSIITQQFFSKTAKAKCN